MAKDVDTGVLEQKVVSMLDALQNGAVTIGKAAVKYAPDVQEAVLAIVRIDALSIVLQSIVVGLFLIGLGVYLFRKLNKLVRYWAEEAKDTFSDAYIETPLPAMGHMACAVLMGVGMAQLSKLLDIWIWVAVFQPKLAIAKRIVDAALNQVGG